MLKRIGIFLFLILYFLPILKIEAQITNAGFVPTNIWYSKDPFLEGDKIKIYTLIFNPNTKELSGKVNFFDNNTLLGKKEFIISPNSAKDISINWTVTVGDHNIFAKIENAKFLISNNKYEEINLIENETTKSTRSVSKKIIPNTNTDTTITDTITTSISDVKNNIPNFISQPVISGTNIIENFRKNTSTLSDNAKNSLKKEIEKLNNPTLKPFKYIELFLFTIFSFIFNNMVIFYGLLIIILFFIFRFIWRKIF